MYTIDDLRTAFRQLERSAPATLPGLRSGHQSTAGISGELDAELATPDAIEWITRQPGHRHLRLLAGAVGAVAVVCAAILLAVHSRDGSSKPVAPTPAPTAASTSASPTTPLPPILNEPGTTVLYQQGGYGPVVISLPDAVATATTNIVFECKGPGTAIALPYMSYPSSCITGGGVTQNVPGSALKKPKRVTITAPARTYWRIAFVN